MLVFECNLGYEINDNGFDIIICFDIGRWNVWFLFCEGNCMFFVCMYFIWLSDNLIFLW